MTAERVRLPIGRAAATPENEGRSKIWLWLAFGVVVLGAVFVWTFLPLERWAESFQGWIQGLGLWGALAYVVLYIVGALLFTPGSIMSIVGGLAFGAWGVPLVLFAATIAGALAFLIARFLARARVAALLEHHPKFKAVDHAVDQEGWKVVALLRLSPLIPYNLQNYALGLTSVGFPAYLAATFFGIVPGTVLFVYLGAIGQLAGRGENSTLQWAFFAVGLLATAVVAILVARKARVILGVSSLSAERK